MKIKNFIHLVVSTVIDSLIAFSIIVVFGFIAINFEKPYPYKIIVFVGGVIAVLYLILGNACIQSLGFLFTHQRYSENEKFIILRRTIANILHYSFIYLTFYFRVKFIYNFLSISVMILFLIDFFSYLFLGTKWYFKLLKLEIIQI